MAHMLQTKHPGGFTIICMFILAGIGSSSIHAQFVNGADIGWLSQMEATGYKFHDSTGLQKNCLQILSDKGINTVRLRVWVNPSDDKINGHCSKNEVVAMAIRAKALGMRIMIDFHYSDSWADPGKQNKPAEWATHTFDQLLTDVYNHTFEVLDTLKRSGVIPQWIQVGNEITMGMLWPDGSTGNWPKLAQLLNKGYDAAKAADSSIKVVIHLDQGNDNWRFRTFFDQAANHGARYDIIGLSYYPYWLGTDYTVSINDLAFNMNDMAARYGKPVIVVETGGDYLQVQNTYNMLAAVIERVKAVPENQGLGVIYWEPQGEKSWSGYQLNCWNADGKPTAAIDAFKAQGTGFTGATCGAEFSFYPNPCNSGILNFEFNSMKAGYEVRIFSIDGRQMGLYKIDGPNDSVRLNLMPGIYLVETFKGPYSVTEKLVVTN